jgi:hypothetical protein
MAYVSDITDVTDMVVEYLKSKAGELGIAFVGTYDERRLPQYPAIVVSPGQKVKVFAGVGKFDVDLVLDIWVYHGDMTVPHSVRNREDLLLVEKIERTLEADYSFDNRIVFGFVAEQSPGEFQSRSGKNTSIIAGTRMRWVATSRRLLRG